MGQPCDGRINHTQTVACWFFPSPIVSACHKAPTDGGKPHTHRRGAHTEGDTQLKKTEYAYRSEALASSIGSHAA